MMRRHGLIALALVLFAVAAARDGVDAWIARTVLPPTLTEVSAEVRDRDGKLLRVYQVGNGIWRLAPGVDRVDPGFIAMLVRYEDKRFRTHPGIDILAMLRATAQAIWHGRTVSGGSTLTMQVARLLEDGSTGRWSGKLRQIRVALALERRLSKDRILELYLTHAPYGGNLEGIRAAALAWFGKEPRRLTPAEAALLVALPQSPETRRPDRHRADARAARALVLARMQDRGILSPDQADLARRARLPSEMKRFPRLAAHLADRAREANPQAPRHDLTVDRATQAQMEILVTQAARRAGTRVSAALIVADHRTGAVIASVGSPGFDATGRRQGFVDMTRAIRSPGSTLKPLVYGLAFDQGLVHPDTLIRDAPVRFGRYAPQNFDGVFRGDIRVREALQMSLNIPVVRLTHELGPPRLMAALRRAGADVRLPGGARDRTPGLAIALGGLGISLHDLVQLYGGLAAGGQGIELSAGLGDAAARRPRLISKVAAWQLGNILLGVAPPEGAPAGAVAYKTGTSYGNRDAWAIGFDGRHVIGVWMGRADGTPVPGAFGGELAAPVLFEAFGRLKPQFDPLGPPPPAALIAGAAQLPPPLRRFRPRDAVFAAPQDTPQLTFPPNGARLALRDDPLMVKLRGGVAPFTLLADGHPVAAGMRLREFQIPSPGRGYSTLVVVDAQGRSDRVQVWLD